MSIEAMKQALEALERIDEAMPFPVGKQAITSLRQAIAEAEQEPVSCNKGVPPMWPQQKDGETFIFSYEDPQPKREWVGLNASEYAAFYNQFAKYQEENADVSGWFEFAEAIEAKLKEKNT